MLEDQHIDGSYVLRWEDIAQDGRPRVEAIALALGVVWDEFKFPAEARALLTQSKIVPIATRFEIEAGDGPFAVGPISVIGKFSLAYARTPSGEIDRLFMDLSAELHAPKGRSMLPPPKDAGERVCVGRAFGEHTFTRPFSPANERRVLSLKIGDTNFVPPRERIWRAPASTLDVSKTFRAIDSDFIFDETPIIMGLSHTDSNQHVNSLVYPRLFEDAVLRHFAALGYDTTTTLSRTLDIGYRRPSFAGEKLSIALRVYEDETGKRICVGAFFGDGERDLKKARVYLRMDF